MSGTGNATYLGAIKLRAFLARNQLNYGDLGRMVGGSPSMVYKWLSGGRPNPRHLLLLRDITAGEIQPNDFYELPTSFRSPGRQRLIALHDPIDDAASAVATES